MYMLQKMPMYMPMDMPRYLPMYLRIAYADVYGYAYGDRLPIASIAYRVTDNCWPLKCLKLKFSTSARRYM